MMFSSILRMPDFSRETITTISIQKKQKRSIALPMSAFARLQAASPSESLQATLMPETFPLKPHGFLRLHLLFSPHQRLLVEHVLSKNQAAWHSEFWTAPATP
jgi:hypothetical protein